MNNATIMDDTLALVLADPSFQRSPVLTRLLRYLVMESLTGRGARLKSYSIAVEGLGKPPEFDSQTDSYARVQVARLRKALDNFYHQRANTTAFRLHIPNGCYNVELIPAHCEDTSPATSTLAPATTPLRRLWQGILGFLPSRLLSCGLIIATAAALLAWQVSTGRVWEENNFPTVEVAPVILDGTIRQSRPVEEHFRLTLINAFGRFDTVRIAERRQANTAYIVYTRLLPAAEGVHVSVSLVRNNDDRLIWSWSKLVSATSTPDLFDQAKVASQIAFHIAQGTGAIHTDQRREISDADTPYSCWLTYNNLRYTRHIIESRALDECSRKWLAHAPAEPLAALTRGWVLVDKSLQARDKAEQHRLMQEAEAVKDHAVQLNPDRASTLSLAMHVSCYSGNVLEFKAVTHRILTLYGDIPDFEGSVGMHMVQHGDQGGRPLLERAIAEHFNPPPRFHLGLFAAALMRDDIGEARRALAAASSMSPDPKYMVMYAAVAARDGRMAEARHAWRQAIAKEKSPEAGLEATLRNWPRNEAVRRALRQWLRPLTT